MEVDKRSPGYTKSLRKLTEGLVVYRGLTKVYKRYLGRRKVDGILLVSRQQRELTEFVQKVGSTKY